MTAASSRQPRRVRFSSARARPIAGDRARRARADAAFIACFDDTGLDAARAMASIPVLGICEAGLSLAAFRIAFHDRDHH